MSFNWFAKKALSKNFSISARAAAMRSCALRFGWLTHKKRSEVFRMAKDATGIDPEKMLSENEVEILVNWMADTRKTALQALEKSR